MTCQTCIHRLHVTFWGLWLATGCHLGHACAPSAPPIKELIQMTAKSQPSLVKFRKEHVRLDYYPAGRAAQAIAQFRSLYPGASTRAIVDALVVAGIKTLVPVMPMK